MKSDDLDPNQNSELAALAQALGVLVSVVTMSFITRYALANAETYIPSCSSYNSKALSPMSRSHGSSASSENFYAELLSTFHHSPKDTGQTVG